MLQDKDKNKEEEPKTDIKPPDYDRIIEGAEDLGIKKKDK